MGIWLIYETGEPVTPEVAASIVKEAHDVGGDRRWILCDGLHFDPFDESHDHRLTGATKILVRPGHDILEPDTEPHDLQVLADALRRWSRVHDLTWHLSTEGGAIGTIQNGETDDQLPRKLDALAQATLELSRDPQKTARDLASRRPHLRIYRGPDLDKTGS